MDLEALTDASMDRVRKLPVPLLVIGLGGTGVHALKTIRRVFAQRFVPPQSGSTPIRTAYLGFDSDFSAQGELGRDECVNITCADFARILHPGHRGELLTHNEQAWVHKDLLVHGDFPGAAAIARWDG